MERLEQVFAVGTFYTVLTVVLLSFRRDTSTKREAVLSRPVGLELRGLAILTVLLGHMTILFRLISMPVTMYLGAQGVEIFLFMSGFGLVSSCQEKGLSHFVKKRLGTVLIPFWFVNLFKIPVTLFLFGGTSITTIFLNFLGFVISLDPTMWYAQYILLCYLLFFILFSYKDALLKSKVFALCFFFTAAAFLTAILVQYGVDAWLPLLECYSHYLSFPFGALFCLYSDRLYILPKKYWAVFSASGLILYWLFSYEIPEILPYYISNISFLLFIVPLFLLLESAGWRSRLLGWIGGLAYEIYLVEYIVMTGVSVLPISSGWKIVLILVLPILIAIPANQVDKRLQAFVIKRVG